MYRVTTCIKKKKKLYSYMCMHRENTLEDAQDSGRHLLPLGRRTEE